MTWKILSFGGVTLPTVLTTVPTGAAPVVTVGTQLPGGAYFDQQGTAQAEPKFPYAFPWRGTILAADRAAVETALFALNAVSGLRAATLIRQLQNGSVQQWCTARLLSVPALARVTDVRTLALELPFQIQSRWFSATPITNTVTLDTSPHTVTLVNAGNAQVTDCVITITAGSAPITSFTLTRAGYSELQYTGTIAAGKALVIDTGAWSVLNDGVDAYTFPEFQRTSNHIENTWLRIPRSVPAGVVFTITITGGSTDSTASFNYYEAWQ